MGIEEQIEQILKRAMPDARVELERNKDTETVGGRVIWNGFFGKNSLQRQNRIFSLLRRELRTLEAHNISFIFAYTPEEYEDVKASV